MLIPARGEVRRGADEKEESVSTVLSDTVLPGPGTTAPTAPAPALREGAFGNATGLSCRECGHRVDLGPKYACPECFGPLEIAYDFPAVTREEIEAGPRNIWRY